MTSAAFLKRYSKPCYISQSHECVIHKMNYPLWNTDYVFNPWYLVNKIHIITPCLSLLAGLPIELERFKLARTRITCITYELLLKITHAFDRISLIIQSAFHSSYFIHKGPYATLRYTGKKIIWLNESINDISSWRNYIKELGNARNKMVRAYYSS